MQSRKLTVLLAIGALAAAVVLFIVLSGDSGSNGGGASREFRFEFANDKPVGGVKQISATQGDHLKVTLHSDAPAQLHVHGYELEKNVDAGATGSIAFTADATGEFEIEAHPLVHGEEAPGVQLAALQVNP
jgi:hypothetical protein